MHISGLAARILAFAVALAALAACEVESYEDGVARFNEGNPAVPPPPAPPPPPPPPPPAAFGPNFSEIQAAVFTPSCATSSCHSGAAPPEGLNLEAANSYAELVNVPSSQDGNIDRVVPFDPDSSYLIQKLEGTAVTGGTMPPGGALDAGSIQTIRTWITNGAVDDRVVVMAPVRVTSVSPGPNATLQSPPTQVVAGFDRDLDASTINANTFIVERSGGDGSFDDGNDVMLPPGGGGITMPTQSSARFDLSGVAMPDDTYRVRLLGDGASVIMDLDGNALDGEFSGAFPSGDSNAGGDFAAQFVISTPVMIGPTLPQIQATVFAPSCATAGCHDSTARANLELSSEDTSYMELVGVPSVQQPALMLVEPGNADNSYLIHKLENAPTIDFDSMPPGQALDPAVILEIRNWIDNGADRFN